MEILRSLPCWVDVDLDAVASNVRALRAWVGAGTAVAGVVKAQAYGLGAYEVASTALAAGAERVAVARVHEGVELRQAGLQGPILVLSRTDPLEADAVLRHRLTPTVDSQDLVHALSEAASRARFEVSVHLKVDTGLHRFGVTPEQTLPLARALSESPGLRVEGLWTHFAGADEEDLSSAGDQLRLFARVVEDLEEAGYRFPVRHAANSAATVALPSAHFDLVRVGQGLYGVNPFDSRAAGLALTPAVSLKARVARVMNLAAGDAVGYGETWRADRPTQVATVTAGYADGVSRSLSNRGYVLIQGRQAPILGRVMMDHVVVDVSQIHGVNSGTEATLFGASDGAVTDIWQVAHDAGTIPHEVLTGIGGRVPRVYWRGGQVAKVARLTGPTELFTA